jgi:phospholipid-binding lipoprotein MlaA
MDAMPHRHLVRRLAVLLLCGALALGATSCARTSGTGASADAALHASEVRDPIEPVNRAVFGFNNFLDMILIEPVAKVYNAVLPRFMRDGIRNFMRNLKSPIIVGNDILQGNAGSAGIATARFIINTTAGVGGLFDVAGREGLAYVPEDFGQTMGVWGAGEGFYLVLPVLGPSNLRDAGGDFADAWADPLRIWSFKTGHDWIYYTRNGVEALDDRARIIKAVDDLRRNSIDYYAAARSAYTQNRRAEIRNENERAAPQIPDYDDETQNDDKKKP